MQNKINIDLNKKLLVSHTDLTVSRKYLFKNALTLLLYLPFA